MSEHVTTIRGDRVAFDHHGPEGAPAVVFIAGAGPHRATDHVTTATAELLAASGIQSTVHDRLGRGRRGRRCTGSARCAPPGATVLHLAKVLRNWSIALRWWFQSNRCS